MPADDALLFIDSNKYLDLYRTDSGKKLLRPLGEQLNHIFVTQQVVGEVQRNKIQVAAEFLRQKFNVLKLQTFNVPDHLSGTTTGQAKNILLTMGELRQKIKAANNDVDSLALGIMEQISRSEDEVSVALAPIFSKAVAHSSDELLRARNRRELGNPPGKCSNPIGDQLTWEQVLTHFKGKKRLWIISRDGDYGTVIGGKAFLNRFLYDELCNITPSPVVYLFEDIVEGILHFVETTGVKAEEKLTAQEVDEIVSEEKSLPSLQESTYAIHREMSATAEMAKAIQQADAIHREMSATAEMAKAILQADAIHREMSATAEMAKAIQQTYAIRTGNQEISKLNPTPENSQFKIEPNLTTPTSDQDHTNKDSVSDEHHANAEAKSL